MSEMKLGILVLIFLPIGGALLIAALTSNTWWVLPALVGVYLLFRKPRDTRRRRHRQLPNTTADGLPMDSNDLG